MRVFYTDYPRYIYGNRHPNLIDIENKKLKVKDVLELEDSIVDGDLLVIFKPT